MRERGRARVFAPAAGVVAVAACAAWFADGGGGGKTARGGEAAAPDVDLAAVELAADERTAESGETARVPLRGAATGEVADVASVSAEDGDLRVVVVDEHGIEHHEESGTLALARYAGPPEDGRLWRSFDHAVEHGRVVGEPDPASVATAGTLGGRPVIPLGDLPRHGPPSGEARVLRVAWAQAIALHVVATDSGEALNGVEYAVAERALSTTWAPPRPLERAQLHRGDSPVSVDAGAFPTPSGAVQVDARAPGYAWGRIAIDQLRGGERRLELVPGGVLEVLLEGGDPERRVFVRVRSRGEPGRELDVGAPRGSGRVRFEALPAGPVEVEVGIARYSDSPIVLGRGDAVVTAGSETTCVVHVEDLPVPDDVRVSGTVVLPAAWGGGAEVGLNIHAIGPLDSASTVIRRPPILGPLEGTDDVYRFSASVEPGRYGVSVLDARERTLAYTAVQVGTVGLDGVALVVAPPAEALLYTVDAKTREPVRFPVLTLVPRLPDGLDLTFDSDFRWDESVGGFRVRVPAGPIDVFPNVSADGFLPPGELDLPPGGSEHTLEVVDGIAIEFELRDDGVPLPVGGLDDVVFAVGHPGRGSRAIRVAGRTLCFVDRPGRYVVSLPELPGYRPVPEREVVVREGETARVVVDLERAR